MMAGLVAARSSTSSDPAIHVGDVLVDVWDDVRMLPIKLIPVPEPAAGHVSAELLPYNPHRHNQLQLLARQRDMRRFRSQCSRTSEIGTFYGQLFELGLHGRLDVQEAWRIVQEMERGVVDSLSTGVTAVR
ncbi:hypothetical protein CERZMDRAFT_90473 [Cercospora zeae-maydis SCOH1-5]|uniref:Uncharacterized protein n=1 Tax=Cercospora zeae-maydis SCOH1-5 TaxID=717836 RepID=A0A6A6FJR0_9PEZI|nr:hypothetical protein CERZMDRAFT_90473 [Cercospora zeae-maydis SCOH1-5]